MRLLSASWVATMEGPPIPGGALLVSEGCAREVGTWRDLSARYPGLPKEEWPGHALVPALVNAHVHLELTALGAPPDRTDFVTWLLEVVGRKREAGAEDLHRGLRAGALECLARGQGLVADVLSYPEAAASYPGDGPAVAVFPEVLAASPERAEAAVTRALSASPALPAALAGLSPHSPYTASEEVYRACAAAVAGRGGLLMTHLAESGPELQFCEEGGGDVVSRLYGSLGLPPPRSPGRHPLEWLDDLGLLGPRAVLVHLVHLGPGHLERLAAAGARVVLCPRSNRFLGVGSAPGRRLLDAGLAVGLGTDSRLSAGDLDLWKDAAAAVEDYGWTPEEALRAATAGGARVLGRGKDWGTFAPGRRADILAVPLPAGSDIWERILRGGRGGVSWASRSPGPAPTAGSGSGPGAKEPASRGRGAGSGA